MNEELELYKLIIRPDEEDDDFTYVDEFGWVKEHFYVWINYWNIKDFIEKLFDIFGYGICDDGGFDANMQSDCICIDLEDVLGGYIDLEDVFPKDKYQH